MKIVSVIKDGSATSEYGSYTLLCSGSHELLSNFTDLGTSAKKIPVYTLRGKEFGERVLMVQRIKRLAVVGSRRPWQNI